MKEEVVNEQILLKYIQGEASEKEKKEVELWSKETSNRKKLEDYKKIWDLSAHISDFDQIDKTRDLSRVKTRISLQTHVKRIPLQKYVLRIAAILILAIGLALGLTRIFQSFQTGQSESLITGDETITFEMPDQSLITLNKNSRVSYSSDFNKTNRNISLDGEVFFEVQPNADLPFKITIDDVLVSVVGTSLNIKKEAEIITVSVLTGTVKIWDTKNTENSLVLQEGDGALFDTQNSMLVYNIPDVNFLAWKTGKFYFENTSLPKVLKLISQYYNKEVLFHNASASNIEITAVFENKTLDEIVHNINLITNLELTLENEQIIVN